MEIKPANSKERGEWNAFVRENYPPVGGFMQSWEWGMFQESLGRTARRYFIFDGGRRRSAVFIVRHALPFGLFYDYAPRGPVFARDATDDEAAKIVGAIRLWARENLPGSVFLRLEPPRTALPIGPSPDYFFPLYYVQPRYNMAIPLAGTEDEIVKRFHPTTRSNLARAMRRGVTVTNGSSVSPADLDSFDSMIRETARRTGGHNAYPERRYFDALVGVFSAADAARAAGVVSLGIFRGYHAGALAAIHLVLFFGDTATYLYGASLTKSLSSKVTTYLHWTAAREAKRRGFLFYDLGGIDDARWPSLTTFKRQFRGKEFRYIGNCDIVMRPFSYRLYNLLRRIKKP